MFIQRYFVLFSTIIYSGALAAIHDEVYINNNRPLGLITFEKNDTFVDWVRIPEVDFNQWIFALKFWRTCSIAVGLLCLIFATLVLAYIIHAFRTNSTGPFNCLGDDKSEDRLAVSDANLPANLQQIALQNQLKLAQQREQDAQKQKYEAERRLSAMLQNSAPLPLYTNQLSLKNSLK